jgi:hypothetical protein
MIRRPIFFLIILLAGCAEQKAHDPIMVGTWQSSFLFIESADRAETDPQWEYFVATPGNWERVMGFKSIRTTYRADGNFSAEYRNLKDSVFVTATGTWHTKGDSLYFFQWAPDTFIVTYQYAVSQDTLKFYGVADWERDGLRNDKVTMSQVRYPRPDSLVAPVEQPKRVH